MRSIVVSLILLVGLSGCTALNQQFPNLGLPESDLTTTQMATATGAAIGGSLGLLAGASTGNAGEGLLVGTLAGTAIGAGVGYYVESTEYEQANTQYQRQINTTDEQLRRRQGEIDRLKQEEVGDVASRTDTYRRGSLKESDVVLSNRPLPANRILPPANVAPKIKGPNSHLPADVLARHQPSIKPRGYNPKTYQGNPRAQRLDGSQVAANTASSARSEVDSYERMDSIQQLRHDAKEREATKRISGAVTTPPIAALPPVVEMPPAKLPSGLPPAKTFKELETEEASESEEIETSIDVPEERTPGKVAKKVEKKTIAAVNKPSLAIPVREETPAKAKKLPLVVSGGSVSKSPSKKKIEEKNIVVDSKPKNEKLPLVLSKATPKTENCLKAQTEAERARNAVSDADKLFYFRRALRLCPRSAQFHTEAGQIYARIGRLEDAQFEFRQAIDLDPDNEYAKQQLSLLDEQ